MESDSSIRAAFACKADALPSEPVDPRDQLAVALDLPSAAEAFRLLDRLGDQCRWVKVGMELFFAEGAALVHQLRQRHLQVFLDLKLHDIPNTVASAIRSLARLDVQLLTVHTLGGPEMLAAAQTATDQCGGPDLLGVTVLTSIDSLQMRQLGIGGASKDQVLRLAHLALAAGLHGLVCSPLEAAPLRAAMGERPYLVTPGVRPSGSAADDQRRISTPAIAIGEGASLLVVGRPITRSSEPDAIFASLLEEIAAANT